MRQHNLDIGRGGADGSYTLILRGELDLITAPRVEAAIAALWSRGASEIVLDLRELGFIDGRGIKMMLLACERSRDRGCGFWLIPGPERIQRPFEIVGLAQLLPFRGIATSAR